MHVSSVSIAPFNRLFFCFVFLCAAVKILDGKFTPREIAVEEGFEDIVAEFLAVPKKKKGTKTPVSAKPFTALHCICRVYSIMWWLFVLKVHDLRYCCSIPHDGRQRKEAR